MRQLVSVERTAAQAIEDVVGVRLGGISIAGRRAVVLLGLASGPVAPHLLGDAARELQDRGLAQAVAGGYRLDADLIGEVAVARATPS